MDSLNKLMVLGVLFFVGGALQAQTKGATVNGRVLRSDGSAVANAQVRAAWSPVGAYVAGQIGGLKWTPADDHGRFRMTLQPGRYVIEAKAEQAGYPDPNVLASAVGAHFPIITVKKSNISGVVVRLGKKGAFLAAYAYDALSKKAVARSKLTLLDARNPQTFAEFALDDQGHFQITVPTKPILIFASAPGYKKAQFADGQPLTLAVGEHRSISLELKRE